MAPGYSKHDLSSTANTRLGTPVYMAPEVGGWVGCAWPAPVPEHTKPGCRGFAPWQPGNMSPALLPALAGACAARMMQHTLACTALSQVIFINSKYDAKKADVWSCGERCASGGCCCALGRVGRVQGPLRTGSCTLLRIRCWRTHSPTHLSTHAHPPTHPPFLPPGSRPAGIILYAMVYGYYPFNPADPKLPKKMMEVSTMGHLFCVGF